jgi:adenosylhomocysteine nucleosidase
MTVAQPSAITLVCFAVSEEARPFARLAAHRADIHVLVTGMGQAATETAIDRAWRQHSPEAVFTCGFAGGLDPALRTGQVLYSADAEFPLAQRLEQAGARPGRFLCVPAVLTTASAKAAARRESGADAVEMESQWVREICRAKEVPSATVRVVLDEARTDLPLDFNQVMGPDQKIRAGKMAGIILRNPAVVPGLIRLGRDSSRAAGALGQVLWNAFKL